MRTECAIALMLTAGVVEVSLEAQGRGRHRQGHDERVAVVASSEPRVAVHVVFSQRDAVIIREYYAPQRRSLPPGLAKKYARTGQLPPGWQKKMQPMPVAVERRLEPLPQGYQRGVFEGHAVIYRPGGVLVDATVIF